MVVSAKYAVAFTATNAMSSEPGTRFHLMWKSVVAPTNMRKMAVSPAWNSSGSVSGYCA